MAHGGKQIKMKKLRVKKWRVKKWVLKALKATKRALKTTMTQAMAMRFELMCLKRSLVWRPSELLGSAGATTP